MTGWSDTLRGSLRALAAYFIGVIPPRDLTVTRMGVTELRVRSYWKTNRRLPASLADLPPFPGRDTAVTDGWGRPIRYDISGPTRVRLSSPGGSGPDEEIVRAFDASDDLAGS